MSERTAYETDHAANVAKLQQLANDADEKRADLVAFGDPRSAIHHAGMRDGLLRAISVIEGRG